MGAWLRSKIGLAVAGPERPRSEARVPDAGLSVCLGRDPANKSKENTMRAVTVREYGGTPAVAEIPTPEPGARQILIRLRAAGMNPMDLWLASGAWKPEGLRGRCLVSPCVRVYRLEYGEWKIAHRYRDDNIRPNQVRQ